MPGNFVAKRSCFGKFAICLGGLAIRDADLGKALRILHSNRIRQGAGTDLGDRRAQRECFEQVASRFGIFVG